MEAASKRGLLVVVDADVVAGQGQNSRCRLAALLGDHVVAHGLG